jgi:alpha-glucosidase (family GH31 glycosyl hydrolase)
VFSLLGKSLRGEVPFLLTTAGYGEYHAGAGSYHFDFTVPGRYRVSGPEIDYFFHYGPTPKEIFEEHSLLHISPQPWPVSTERFASWATLRNSMVRIVQGAMSAANTPLFDLTPYNNAPEELKTRARQMGSIVARVTPGTVGLSGLRQQLDTFYGSYLAEMQDRGFPVWHPLPFQFPEDQEGARHTDEFMLGDEMLIAPIYEPGEQRTVYLPRGIWTSLETNEVTYGPKTITVKTKSLPVFARNGAIVPLNSANGMALHYFPKLGGEFFLLEGDIAEYTQVHAAPALDFMRLEIESKKERDYQWVVHHVDQPSEVGFEGKTYRQVERAAEMGDRTWFYDAAGKNLQVRAKVKAGEDCIINVSF